MDIINQATLDQLNALSSAELVIHASSTQITMRLGAIVSVSNYKFIASAGRAARGASFDTKTRTLTLNLIPMSDMTKQSIGFLDGGPAAKGYTWGGSFFEMSDETYANAVGLYPADNLKRLISLARRLAGGKAKIFATTNEAWAKRNARKAKYNPHEIATEDMDMPMWDPVAGEWFDMEIETRAHAEMRDPSQRQF